MKSFIDGLKLLAMSNKDIAYYLEWYEAERSIYGKQELIKEISNYIKEMGLEDELSALR